MFVIIFIGLTSCNKSEEHNNHNESPLNNSIQNRCDEFLNSDFFLAKKAVLNEQGYGHSNNLTLAMFLYSDRVDHELVDCE